MLTNSDDDDDDDDDDDGGGDGDDNDIDNDASHLLQTSPCAAAALQCITFQQKIT